MSTTQAVSYFLSGADEEGEDCDVQGVTVQVVYRTGKGKVNAEDASTLHPMTLGRPGEGIAPARVSLPHWDIN
jgi:hypothetical protein